jgi:hypothetical protein
VAIFGPRSKANSEHIKSISDSMEIPYIETRWNYRSQDIIGELPPRLTSQTVFRIEVDGEPNVFDRVAYI